MKESLITCEFHGSQGTVDGVCPLCPSVKVRGLDSYVDKQEILANVIIDLYEMRASTLSPMQARQVEKMENLFQYNFIHVIISMLCDKYHIKNRDIEEVLRERNGASRQTLKLNN